jgi:hypothetical protein
MSVNVQYIYSYAHTCMYVSKSIKALLCIGITSNFLCAYMHTYIHTYIHTHTYVYTNINLCTYVYIYIHIFKICIHMYVYLYTYMHTYTPTKDAPRPGQAYPDNHTRMRMPRPGQAYPDNHTRMRMPRPGQAYPDNHTRMRMPRPGNLYPNNHIRMRMHTYILMYIHKAVPSRHRPNMSTLNLKPSSGNRPLETTEESVCNKITQLQVKHTYMYIACFLLV